MRLFPSYQVYSWPQPSNVQPVVNGGKLEQAVASGVYGMTTDVFSAARETWRSPSAIGRKSISERSKKAVSAGSAWMAPSRVVVIVGATKGSLFLRLTSYS